MKIKFVEFGPRTLKNGIWGVKKIQGDAKSFFELELSDFKYRVLQKCTDGHRVLHRVHFVTQCYKSVLIVAGYYKIVLIVAGCLKRALIVAGCFKKYYFCKVLDNWAYCNTLPQKYTNIGKVLHKGTNSHKVHQKCNNCHRLLQKGTKKAGCYKGYLLLQGTTKGY